MLFNISVSLIKLHVNPITILLFMYYIIYNALQLKDYFFAKTPLTMSLHTVILTGHLAPLQEDPLVAFSLPLEIIPFHGNLRNKPQFLFHLLKQNIVQCGECVLNWHG